MVSESGGFGPRVLRQAAHRSSICAGGLLSGIPAGFLGGRERRLVLIGALRFPTLFFFVVLSVGVFLLHVLFFGARYVVALAPLSAVWHKAFLLHSGRAGRRLDSSASRSIVL